MSSQQGSVIPGDFSVATIATVLPPAAYRRFVAWTTDSTPPGYAVCDGASWTPPSTPAAYTFPVGAPVARTLSLATAYQASNPAKPALVSILINLTGTIAIGTVANTIQLWVGPTAASVTTPFTGATVADGWRNDLTVTLISITVNGQQKLQAMIPAGYWFAAARSVGTGTTIASAFDQVMG